MLTIKAGVLQNALQTTSNAVCKNQDCVCGSWCLYECIKNNPVLIIGNINESQFWKKQFNLK